MGTFSFQSNITQEMLINWYSYLSAASILDDTILIKLTKNQALVEATSIKKHPTTQKSYGTIVQSVDSISKLKDAKGRFFSSWTTSGAAATYWDGFGSIYALFSGKEFMSVIKRYAVENDTNIKMRLELEANPKATGYWARTIGLDSDEISTRIGGNETVIACSSFDTDMDNGYEKLNNTEFYHRFGGAEYLETPSAAELKYAALIPQSKLKTLKQLYTTGEVVCDITQDKIMYFNNYAVAKKQISAFIMGEISDAFSQTSNDADEDVIDVDGAFTLASPNLQITNGAKHPHTTFAPQFNIDRFNAVVSSSHNFTDAIPKFMVSVAYKAPSAPENGMGGNANPALRWLHCKNQSAGAGGVLEMRINQTAKAFNVVTNSSSSDLGRFVVIGDGDDDQPSEI